MIRKSNLHNLIGAGLIATLGIAVVIHTSTSLRLGTFANMGPGMFPLMIGIILAGLGALNFISAMFTSEETGAIEWKNLAIVVLSILVFAVSIRSLGLIPATILLIVAARLADSRRSLAFSIGFPVVPALLAYGIFVLGLGLPIPVMRWPF